MIARHAGGPDHRRDRLPLPGARAHRGRRNEPAYVCRMSWPSWPRSAAGAWPRPRRAPRTPSSPCSTGFPGHERRRWSSPSWAAARPAACRGPTANWGVCDPADPKQPALALLAAGAPASARGRRARDHRRGRHLAGPAPADGRRPARSGWTRCCSPTTTPTRCTASTTSAPSSCASGRRIALPHGRGHPRHADAAVRLYLRGRGRLSGHLRRPTLIPPHGVAWAVDGPSGAIPVVTFDQDHGGVRSVGYRFGDVAYSSDVVDLPTSGVRGAGRPRGLDRRRAALHAAPDPRAPGATLEWIDRAKARRAILTNLHIDLDFKTLQAELPAGVEPAYDGLRFSIEA